MNQLTKISLAWELFLEGVSKTHIAKQLSLNRETVRIWVKAIERNPFGLTGFIGRYLSAKKGERTKRKSEFKDHFRRNVFKFARKNINLKTYWYQKKS